MALEMSSTTCQGRKNSWVKISTFSHNQEIKVSNIKIILCQLKQWVCSTHQSTRPSTATCPADVSLDVRHWTHNLHSRYKPIRLTASIKVIRMQMHVIKPDTLLTPSVTFVMKICSFLKHKLTALIWTAGWVNNTTSEMQVKNQVNRHRLSCSLSSRGGAAFMTAHFHSSHFSEVHSLQTDQVCLTDRNGDETQMVTWWCDLGGLLTLLFCHSSLCI